MFRLLINDDLDYFNRNLANSEKELGEENLIKIFYELESQEGGTEEILKKLESLIFEICTGLKLKKRGFKNLEKINKYGDWKAEESIISVKSILDLDFNFQIIDNVLRGLIYNIRVFKKETSKNCKRN